MNMQGEIHKKLLKKGKITDFLEKHCKKSLFFLKNPLTICAVCDTIWL